MGRSSVIIAVAAILAVVCQGAERAAGPDGKPVREITSKDKGPDIDPKGLAAQRFSGLRLFKTFRSFVSSSYALADVWIYAADDDQTLNDTAIVYPYPDSYMPTWGELFDHVARQMQGKWEFDPGNRQFKFSRDKGEPPFGVELAKDWQREDRGIYVWHAPKGAKMGMDIYDMGHYSADAKQAEVMEKARAHAAMFIVGRFPEPPNVEKMERVQVAGVEALYVQMDTPRPGGLWRQWALVKDGHAFLIVSAMPKENAKELSPTVDAMVKTFKASGDGK